MMFNFHLSSSLLIFVSVIYSKISESEAIVKGKDAQIGDFPSIVSLRNETGGHYCGGTLVTYEHVVTAAHCLYDDLTVFFQNETGMLRPENVKVSIGTLSSTQGGDIYEVEKFIKHPEYDINAVRSYINDVAVVVLKQQVDTGNAVPTAIEVTFPKDNALGNAAGWGLLNYNDEFDPMHQNDYPTNLQKLSVMIQDKEKCAKKYSNNIFVSFTTSLINTSYILYSQPVVRGAGMCVRDSGSPLFIDGEFVGHLIAGVPCGHGYPDLFVATAAHQDFLESAIHS